MGEKITCHYSGGHVRCFGIDKPKVAGCACCCTGRTGASATAALTAGAGNIAAWIAGVLLTGAFATGVWIAGAIFDAATVESAVPDSWMTGGSMRNANADAHVPIPRASTMLHRCCGPAHPAQLHTILCQVHNSPLKNVGIEDPDGVKCSGRCSAAQALTPDGEAIEHRYPGLRVASAAISSQQHLAAFGDTRACEPEQRDGRRPERAANS